MVEIVCEDGDVVFEDNYFDLNAEPRTIQVLRGEGARFSVRSVYDIG
jgi:beta-mannosidase